MRALQIIKREIVVALSRLGPRKVTSDYMGMRLVTPVVHGMVNGGYLVPAEYWMSDCLAAFIKTKKGCVLDVGSSVGVYLVKLRVLSQDVEYYGVEPNHASNFYVQQLIRLNRFENARILPFALSDHEGVGTIYAGALGSKRGTSLKPDRPGGDPPHTFEAYFTTGDELVGSLGLDEMAVLKLDVEGAELEALRGLAATIRAFRPYIYCEILASGEDPDRISRAVELCRLVRGMGYEILGVRGESRTLEIIPHDEQVGQKYWEEYVLSPVELVAGFLDAMRRNTSGVRIAEELPPPTR